MKKMELNQMSQIEGGIDCRSAGQGATVLGALGLGLTVVALVATGPLGVAAGIMASIWGVGSGITSLGLGIACW